MPNYLITSPDGRKFRVTAPAGASQAQVLSYAQAHWGSLSGAPAKPQPPSPINQEDAAMGAGVVSGLGSAALGTAQLAGHALTSPVLPAPTTGLMAGPGRIMTDITKAENIPGEAISEAAGRGLDWLKKETEPYQQAHPEAYEAGNIAGQMGAALAPGAAAHDIGTAATLLGRVGQASRAGAVAGAEQPVSGPDFGEKKLKETAENIAGAAATAGLLEGSGLAASGIGRFLARTNPESLRSQAVQKIAQRVAEDEKGGGPSAESIINTMNASRLAGVPRTLMEVGGENLKGLAGSISRAKGPARAAIYRSFRDRLQGAAQRLTNAVRQNFDAPESRRQVSNALSASQMANSKPLYEAAFKPSSMASIKDQFADSFNRISREKKEAIRDWNAAKQYVTITAAKMSQVGRDPETNRLAMSEMAVAQNAAKEAFDRVRATEMEHADIVQQLKTAQSAESKGKGAAVYSPYIARLLTNPRIQEGIRKGLEIQRNEADAANVRFDPTDYAVKYDAEGNPQLFKAPNMRLLDAAKKGLDDIIEQYRDPVTAKLNLDERGRSINQLRVSLLNELDRINQAYKLARSAWAGPAASKGAMAQGEKILSTHPEDVKAIFDEMTPAEQEHYRIGAAQAYLDQISESGVTSAAIRKLSRDENESTARQRLKPIFKTKQQLDNFIEAATGERQIHDAMRDIVGNSATARRMVEDTMPDLMPYLNLAHGAMHAAHGRIIPAVQSVANAISGIKGRMTPQLNEEIARILTDPNVSILTPAGEVSPMFRQPAPTSQFLPVTPIVTPQNNQ
jgi:rubrerythrin